SDAECSKFSDMGCLTNAHMDYAEHVTACIGKKPPQHRKNHACSLVKTEIAGREKRNENGNTDCGEPVLEARTHRRHSILSFLCGGTLFLQAPKSASPAHHV